MELLKDIGATIFWVLWGEEGDMGILKIAFICAACFVVAFVFLQLWNITLETF